MKEYNISPPENQGGIFVGDEIQIFSEFITE